jgi:hypothetical protein
LEIAHCGETPRYGLRITDSPIALGPEGAWYAMVTFTRGSRGEMPDPVARQPGDTPQVIARHVVEDGVIERYRSGGFQRQIGEALGLNYWQTEAFLRERGVPVNHSAVDLEADEAALRRISRGS